jgi:hypothetical protein
LNENSFSKSPAPLISDLLLSHPGAQRSSEQEVLSSYRRKNLLTVLLEALILFRTRKIVTEEVREEQFKSRCPHQGTHTTTKIQITTTDVQITTLAPLDPTTLKGLPDAVANKIIGKPPEACLSSFFSFSLSFCVCAFARAPRKKKKIQSAIILLHVRTRMIFTGGIPEQISRFQAFGSSCCRIAE